MAVARKKNKETENTHVYNIEVSRAKELDSGDIALDLIVNGVSIYGAFYVTRKVDGKETSFLSFPSRKGSDGKHYKYVYFPMNDAQLAQLEKDIEAAI